MLQYGAPGETRTLKIWNLNPTRMPIPSPGLKSGRPSQIQTAFSRVKSPDFIVKVYGLWWVLTESNCRSRRVKAKFYH